MNPGQDYNKLASDASRQYLQQNPGQLGLNNVGNYFGLGNIGDPGGGGDQLMAQAGHASEPGLTVQEDSPYPQSWIDTFQNMDPATQQMIAQRYQGMSPEQIMQDWEQNIMPQYAPNTTTEQILSGSPTASQTLGSGANPGNDLRGAYGVVGTEPSNTGAYAPGSGVEGKDPWTYPVHRDGQGRLVFAPGYGQTPVIENTNWMDPVTGQPNWQDEKGNYVPRHTGGEIYQWDGGKPPAPGSANTKEGAARLRQPVSAAGQQFGNMNQFLKFMGTSTPGQQGLKTQMEHLDDKGGSLEAGEKSLFSVFAPYLGQNVKKPPTGATPFTDWDPIGLLDLLQKSGLLK
jgi:hypothetical protein